MSFEQRLSMLLEIITAVLPTKARYPNPQNKRRASKGSEVTPKDVDTDTSTANPQSPKAITSVDESEPVHDSEAIKAIKVN